MPGFQNDDTFAIIDLNDPTRQIPVSSGSTASGSLGFLFYGVNTGGLVESMQVTGGALQITGSVAANFNPASILSVKILSGSTEVGTPQNPLVTTGRPYATTIFGQARTANPYTLADLINKYGLDSQEYGTQIVAGGGISELLNQSGIILSASAASGARATLRTHTFYRYQAGKEQNVKITLYHSDTGRTNQIRRWGTFDDSDGLFFAVSGSLFGIYRRSSTTGIVAETFVSQSSFNIDKLNGTGMSGFTLDVTRANLYEIQYQWGAGSAEFYINGIRAHQLVFSNTLTTAYMRTGQLPLAWEIVNAGASTVGGNMVYLASTVSSEGAVKSPETVFTAFNPSDRSIRSDEQAILAIRPKLTINTVANRIMALPSNLSISTEGARISYRVILNPATLGGSVWSDVSVNSGYEVDVASTTFSGGETIYYGFLPNPNDAATIDLSRFFNVLGRKLRLDAFGTIQDVLVVVARNEAGGSTNVRVGLTWMEVK